MRIEYLSRRGDGVGVRVIEPHRIRGVRGDWYVDTYDRTADGRANLPRRPHPLGRALRRGVRRRGPGVGNRDDDELSTTAGTASVWFSPDVARWELEGRPDTIPLADGGALASVPYGSERWLATELCRYLGDAVLLEPEATARGRRGARARARCRTARADRRTPRHPVIRYLSDAEVATLLPPPAEACELARRIARRPRGRARRAAAEDLGAAAIATGFVNAMPAYCCGPDAVAVKIVGVYQSNSARGLPTIAGVVVSIDRETGRMRGILGAGEPDRGAHGGGHRARAWRGSRPPRPGRSH